MSVRCVFLGAPENLGFLGRAEALVARRFSGAVSAMRLKCRMRVQNYCFFLTWQWVVPRLVQSVSPDLYNAPIAAQLSPQAQPILWPVSAGTPFLWPFSALTYSFKGLFVVPRGKSFGFLLIFL